MPQRRETGRPIPIQILRLIYSLIFDGAGISWDPKLRRWLVRIQINGKQTYIGRCKDEEGALQVRAREKQGDHNARARSLHFGLRNGLRFWTFHANSLRCEKRHFLSHLYIKTNILPRQARDKHRENSKKGRFLAGLFLSRSGFGSGPPLLWLWLGLSNRA
jgi:hypothetical protein